MCIELHMHSPESMQELIKMERETESPPFVPSQFHQGSIADVVRDGMDRAYDEGFQMALIKVQRMLLDYDVKVYANVRKMIEGLKP